MQSGHLLQTLDGWPSILSIHLPPLRERREAIIPLANNFLKRFSRPGQILSFSKTASCELRNFDWPGNLRQLQNEIQRAVLMTEGPLVELRDLSIGPNQARKDEAELTLMASMERDTIIQLLTETGGNKAEAAKRLGIGRQTLYNKIKEYGIQAETGNRV